VDLSTSSVDTPSVEISSPLPGMISGELPGPRPRIDASIASPLPTLDEDAPVPPLGVGRLHNSVDAVLAVPATDASIVEVAGAMSVVPGTS
jgi:hypothetical protein